MLQLHLIQQIKMKCNSSQNSKSGDCKYLFFQGNLQYTKTYQSSMESSYTCSSTIKVKRDRQAEEEALIMLSPPQFSFLQVNVSQERSRTKIIKLSAAQQHEGLFKFQVNKRRTQQAIYVNFPSHIALCKDFTFYFP